MTVQQFFTKYNNKPLDVDGAYGSQCVDVFQAYDHEVIGGHAPSLNAIEYYTNYNSDLYDRIENTPEGIPQVGDVIIWNVGRFGHIALFSSGDVNSFISFDQNWPTQGYTDDKGNFIGTGYCHYQSHENYANVVGWLRPKKVVVVQSNQMSVPDYFEQLLQERHLDPTNEGEIRAFFGNADAFPGLQADLQANEQALAEARDQNAQLQSQISNLDLANHQLQDEVNALKAQPVPVDLSSPDSVDANPKPLHPTPSFVMVILARLKEIWAWIIS